MLSQKIYIHKYTLAKKYNENHPTMTASTPHLVDWCQDKDNPTSKRPGKHAENYVQIKSQFNRATTTWEIKQTHSTHKTKNRNNHHTIHTVNNFNFTLQLYTHRTKTQTLSSTSHASSTKHTTKSVTDIDDNKTFQAQNTNLKIAISKYVKTQKRYSKID